MPISFNILTDLSIAGDLTLGTITSSLLRVDSAGVVSSVSLTNLTLSTGGALTLATALTSINSITSVAGQNLVLATGTTGTALTFASATNIATFTAGITGTSATFSSLTAGRVTFAGASGLLTDDADMTFATDTLTVTKATIGGISHVANAITAANSVTANTTTDLTLSGGSSGASLVLGQGVGGNVAITPSGDEVLIEKATGRLRVVVSNPLQPRGLVSDNVGNFANSGTVLLRKARGTEASKTAVLANDSIGNVCFSGYDGTTYQDHQAIIQAWAAENYSPTTTGAYMTVQLTSPSAGHTIFEHTRFTETGNLLVATIANPASLAGGLVLNGSGSGAAATGNGLGTLRVIGGGSFTGAVWAQGRISQNPPAALAGTSHYMATNMSNLASTTLLNPGLMVYNDATNNTFGMDLGYVASTYRTRLLTAANGAFSWAYPNTNPPTAQSHFTEIATLDQTAFEMNGGVRSIGGSNPSITTSAIHLYTTGGAPRIASVRSGSGDGRKIFDFLHGGDGVAAWRVVANNFAAAATVMTMSGDSASSGSGKVDFPGTTSASSATLGTVTIGNGTAATNVAIGGGNINAGGTLTVGGAALFNSNTAGFADDTFFAWDNAGSNRLGFVKKTGSVPILAHGSGTTFTISRSSAASVAAGSTFTSELLIGTTGDIAITSSSPSTGVGTGALQVAGGIYAGAASVFAGTVSVTNTTEATTSGVGSLISSGGIYSAKAIIANRWETITGTLTYSATPSIDFTATGLRTITLTGDCAFAASTNVAAGRGQVLRIVGDSVSRNLSFPAGWVFVGGSAPTTISANKTAMLSAVAFGGTDSTVIVAYSVQS